MLEEEMPLSNCEPSRQLHLCYLPVPAPLAVGCAPSSRGMTQPVGARTIEAIGSGPPVGFPAASFGPGAHGVRQV